MDNEKLAREIVYERSGLVCEVCGRARATDWSHRKPRSQGGLWCPTNGLHTCHPHHMLFHRHPEKSRAMGWFVSSSDDPAAAPVYTRHGRVLLHENGAMSAAPLWPDMPALAELRWD